MRSRRQLVKDGLPNIRVGMGLEIGTGAGIYLNHGYFDPTVAFPVRLGVLAGAMAGARLLPGAKPIARRWLCYSVLWIAGVQMIYQGLF